MLQEIKANYSSPVARFAVSGLHPGNLYILSIYAFNGKGRSEPAVLQAAMLRLPEKQLTSEKGEYTASILIYRLHAQQIHNMSVCLFNRFYGNIHRLQTHIFHDHTQNQ